MTNLEEIERIVSEDAGNRGIAPLIQWGHLARAAEELLSARAVLIVSGFFIPRAMAGETDGPPGAKALGHALLQLDIETAYLTDRQNQPLFEALVPERLFTTWEQIPSRSRPTHLVAIERLGRAADGHYYNMLGQDIGAYTEPLDQIFLDAAKQGMVTIAIGDGGNEIGMGGVEAAVKRHIPHGERIACIVPADHLIVAGVSNWGAYGLIGALSILSGRDLLPSASEAAEDVARIVAAGAVDGQTHRCEPTVDGLPLEKSLSVLEEIRLLVDP